MSNVEWRANRTRSARPWGSSASICCRCLAEGFELAEISFPVVDSKGCVKARTNCYSTPLKPGTQTRVKLLPAYVEVWQERECVARHERSSSRYEQVLDLEHYLDVLERKPGALAGSSPLKQWRERGRWPESF